jgi:hypothetical protein
VNLSSYPPFSTPDELAWAWWQEAERAFQRPSGRRTARQVAEQQESGGVAVEGGQEGKEGEAPVDTVVQGLPEDEFLGPD